MRMVSFIGKAPFLWKTHFSYYTTFPENYKIFPAEFPNKISAIFSKSPFPNGLPPGIMGEKKGECPMGSQKKATYRQLFLSTLKLSACTFRLCVIKKQ